MAKRKSVMKPKPKVKIKVKAKAKAKTKTKTKVKAKAKTVVKKHARKVQEKKKRRRIRCLRVQDAQKLCEIINRIQVKRVETRVFVEDEDLRPIAENIMRDAGLEFVTKKDLDRYFYLVSPGPENTKAEVILDKIDDEDFEGDLLDTSLF